MKLGIAALVHRNAAPRCVQHARGPQRKLLKEMRELPRLSGLDCQIHELARVSVRGGARFCVPGGRCPASRTWRSFSAGWQEGNTLRLNLREFGSIYKLPVCLILSQSL